MASGTSIAAILLQHRQVLFGLMALPLQMPKRHSRNRKELKMDESHDFIFLRLGLFHDEVVTLELPENRFEYISHRKSSREVLLDLWRMSKSDCLEEIPLILSLNLLSG